MSQRLLLFPAIAALSCSTPATPARNVQDVHTQDTSPPDAGPDLAADLSTDTSPAPFAHVTEVAVLGETFSVTIESQETGCDQYASWWEVTSANGAALLYRRILGHSHVNEQPFTRSGGPVLVAPDEEVVVRAHMHPSGYGGQAWRGTISGGFERTTLPAGFGTGLQTAQPLPTSCAF